jgi:hypothetical protein
VFPPLGDDPHSPLENALSLLGLLRELKLRFLWPPKFYYTQHYTTFPFLPCT